MSVTTEQDKMSLISYGIIGPWVAMGVSNGDANDVLEPVFHAGPLAAMLGLYGGTDIMAVTYRAGVYAGSDNLALGTLRSDATSAGTQIYFVSLDDVLGYGELANGTPTASSTNSSLTIANVAVNTAALSTNDGTVVAPIGRAIEFRVTLPTSTYGNARAPILVHYPTDGSNAGNITVYLDIQWNA